jgi:radical SAM superfamily enzyme YgiQ (UPF0313 family)
LPRGGIFQEECFARFIDYAPFSAAHRNADNLVDPQSKILERVRGITSQTPQGKIKHNAERPAIDRLEELPFPAYKYFKLERYTSLQPAVDTVERGKSFSMMTSRGCPYRCTF